MKNCLFTNGRLWLSFATPFASQLDEFEPVNSLPWADNANHHATLTTVMVFAISLHVWTLSLDNVFNWNFCAILMQHVIWKKRECKQDIITMFRVSTRTDKVTHFPRISCLNKIIIFTSEWIGHAWHYPLCRTFIGWHTSSYELSP